MRAFVAPPQSTVRVANTPVPLTRPHCRPPPPRPPRSLYWGGGNIWWSTPKTKGPNKHFIKNVLASLGANWGAPKTIPNNTRTVKNAPACVRYFNVFRFALFSNG